MTINSYRQATNLLYGEGVGDLLYDFAEKLCHHAFKGKISPEIPIILTTAMSPYNRFCGWYNSEANVIEIVRQHCVSSSKGIVPKDNQELLITLTHEFCHIYQYEILGGATGSRGPHRCQSWYSAITHASPYVCGVNIDGLCKPLKSVRIDGKVRKEMNKKSLSEKELTHWPNSIIKLANEKDTRLNGRIVSSPLF